MRRDSGSKAARSHCTAGHGNAEREEIDESLHGELTWFAPCEASSVGGKFDPPLPA